MSVSNKISHKYEINFRCWWSI